MIDLLNFSGSLICDRFYKEKVSRPVMKYDANAKDQMPNGEREERDVKFGPIREAETFFCM